MKFGIPPSQYYQLAKTTSKVSNKHFTKKQAGLSVGAIVALLIVVALYYTFEWMTPARWAVGGGSIVAIAIGYSLIRWRRNIFSEHAQKPPLVATVSSPLVWQPIAPADCPLWLAHRLYELQFKHRMRRTTFTINGKIWQYKIDINPSVSEPFATIKDIQVHKSRRG